MNPSLNNPKRNEEPSTAPVIAIIQTGTANLAAVCAAFRRLQVSTRLIQRPDEIGDAVGVVLPGVGAFASARSNLTQLGWDDAIRERIQLDLPTLAICLGLQLLCESSEESPGVPGLGVLPVRVERFRNELAVPQLGWNQVTVEGTPNVLQSGFVYFANSYRLGQAPAGWQAAYSEYGERFVAAVERGRVVACQFHPELSGEFGSQLLSDWLKGCREESPC